MSSFNPDFEIAVVARRRKPVRNVQLERFCNEGISIRYVEEENRETSVAARIFKPQ